MCSGSLLIGRMRPTRWTRKPRATYYGKGGWSVRWHGISYTHPVTGDGYSAGFNVRTVLRLRRKQEAKREAERNERRRWDAMLGITPEMSSTERMAREQEYMQTVLGMRRL
jgi:isopentenyldiphosphate isomerase